MRDGSYAEVLRLRASAKSVWGPWGASGDRHGQLGAPFPAGRALTRVRRFVASTWPVGSMTFALGPRGLSDDVSTKRRKTVQNKFGCLRIPSSL